MESLFWRSVEPWRGDCHDGEFLIDIWVGPLKVIMSWRGVLGIVCKFSVFVNDCFEWYGSLVERRSEYWRKGKWSITARKLKIRSLSRQDPNKIVDWASWYSWRVVFQWACSISSWLVNDVNIFWPGLSRRHVSSSSFHKLSHVQTPHPRTRHITAGNRGHQNSSLSSTVRHISLAVGQYVFPSPAAMQHACAHGNKSNP